MASIILKLTVRMPKWRLRVMWLAVFLVAPFVRKQETGERIIEALSSWVGRGLKVYADGERVR